MCAYTNIGTIYRGHKNFARAHFWFLKAFKKGDGDAALEIGTLYMRDEQRWKQAEKYLRLALRAKNVTEDSKEEAANLLKDIKRRVS